MLKNFREIAYYVEHTHKQQAVQTSSGMVRTGQHCIQYSSHWICSALFRTVGYAGTSVHCPLYCVCVCVCVLLMLEKQ